MKAATSAIVKHKDHTDKCMYCGGNLTKWETKIENGLERRVKKCENGHQIRKKKSKVLSIKQFTRAHLLDH